RSPPCHYTTLFRSGGRRLRGRGRRRGAAGAHRTLGRRGTRHDLDHVVATGLIGHGLEVALGAEHQLRTLAALAGVDALHGRREVGDVERTLQRGRQRGVADVDDDAGALGPEVGTRALAVEAQDQLAGAAVATLEVHG